MEERVGLWWHRLLVRTTRRQPMGAGVELPAMATELAVMFRALGGAHGLKLEAAAGVRNGATRNWMERMAGARDKVELAQVDAQSVRLPIRLDVYPDDALNRDLYRWLAALCAVVPPHGGWMARNLMATATLLQHFKGLAGMYQRLAQAELQRRPDPARLKPADAAQERRIRRALLNPIDTLEIAKLSALAIVEHAHGLEPVMLWLSPHDLVHGAALSAGAEPQAHVPPSGQQDKKKRQAVDAQMPDRQGGLLIFRPESIFSWAEYAKVQHEAQENDDEDLAQAADDLDTLSVADDAQSIAKTLRMNLDRAPRLEAEAGTNDADLHVPEWDHRRGVLKPDHCTVRIQAVPDRLEGEQPARDVRDGSRRLHKRLALLAQSRRMHRGLRAGDELDFDALIRARAAGDTDADCFQELRRSRRDFACLLLADLSLSTEAALADGHRVIDVIQSSLTLFGEALRQTRDRFAIYGFNSRQRHRVNLWEVKRFDQVFGDETRTRIAGLSPFAYTRMGAALRQSAAMLGKEKSRERLLLLLTDGKPNDSDDYEGRYGIEDTRRAVQEIRRMGLKPFCVTVDQNAEDYLPHMFGKHGFAIVRRPSELPLRLTQLYAQLTG